MAAPFSVEGQHLKLCQQQKRGWNAREALTHEEQQRWRKESLDAGHAVGGALSATFGFRMANGMIVEIVQRLDGPWVLKSESMDHVATRDAFPLGATAEDCQAWETAIDVIDEREREDVFLFDRWVFQVEEEEKQQVNLMPGDKYVRTGFRGEVEGTDVDRFYLECKEIHQLPKEREDEGEEDGV